MNAFALAEFAVSIVIRMDRYNARYIPSMETLFLIGGIAPRLLATPKGLLAENNPKGRPHNFAPSSLYVMKLNLATTTTTGPAGEEEHNLGGANRLSGYWAKVEPTGHGPGEICGHTALVDPKNDRYIYVSADR